MKKSKGVIKEPISREKIFKTMLLITYIVSAVFLVKNIIGKSLLGAVTIGISLAVFTIVLVIMKCRRAKEEIQEFVVSISLVLIVFVISLNSGDYYSDDFPLYLAVLGLTGMYLRPRYTIIQGILASVLLVVQYLIHPEKADKLGQYIMCLALFMLAGFVFYLAIKRGRAFINKSQERAEDAEQLSNSLLVVGNELKRNFEGSSKRIEKLQMADSRLEGNARELRQSSETIAQVAREVEDTCDNVQGKIQVTEEQLISLNNDVRTFESILADNSRNLEVMNKQMEIVKRTMQETNEVFHILENRMNEIFSVTEELNSISGSTTMLALNASIEAARAGQAGAGFAVVASKVKELAVDSNACSSRVVDVINAMHEQIEKTTSQLGESTEAINASLGAMEEVKGGFNHLTNQFDSLYGNIEEQNNNVNGVEAIFEELKDKIRDMTSHSGENQASVEAIADAMDIYKENMSEVIEDTRHIHELSESMLRISGDKNI
ncbi:MAG: methyl-accepting chemotaxis protein [Butyrivibrio sp.]